MRLLRRNTTTFEYLPYTGLETDLNEDGEHTGDFRPELGDPVEYRGNISAPNGQTQQQFYGADIRYTHTLVMDRTDVAIDEYGCIRWKGELYDIAAVRPSINFLSIALRKQTGNHGEPYEPDPEPEPDEPTEPDESEPEGEDEP